jgi:hypothetical protein
MHRLCIDCHCVKQSERGAREPYLTRCSCCHRGVGSTITVTPGRIPRRARRIEGDATHEHG